MNTSVIVVRLWMDCWTLGGYTTAGVSSLGTTIINEYLVIEDSLKMVIIHHKMAYNACILPIEPWFSGNKSLITLSMRTLQRVTR